ncbi:MAG: glycosyltransferase family 4 protein [Betaproteobacteria bacterium]|nr:glycosyltransferase family 4 protein [Betaproteobacteria bacterium]
MNPEVIITNMKKRYSGVSGTINALLPVQAKTMSIGFVGTDLPGAQLAQSHHPNTFFYLSVWQAIRISRKRLPNGQARIWHVRRDPEMMLTIFLRDVLRFPIKIVFTSAAKHRHSWFPRWLISKMDGVISTTPEAASFVPNTTRVVPHGISLERFSPPKDKLTIWRRTGLPGKYGIGTFGRVRPDKGMDIFVDAMIQLLPAFPDFTAVIAGLCTPQYTGFQTELQQKINAAGLSERIIFLGVIDADTVADWYQNVLITVACPRYEPFGLTPLEGMACGCAVVASDTGAFRTIVEEGKTGYVVTNDDVEELTKAIKSLMDAPMAIAMGKQGREKVAAQFTVDREADGIASVYTVIWHS